MGRIVCEECGKVYDFDRDEFCPRCGAFNQPVKTWGMDAKGNVIRVDGVSERNHEGSFVHKEVHREKAVRRAVGMDWKGAKGPRKRELQAKTLFWIIAAIVLFSVVLPLLATLLELLF